MIYIKSILILFALWQIAEPAPQPCTELKYQEIECHETEYHSYRDCIHRQRENRLKRQLLIESSPCKIYVRSIPKRDLYEFVSQTEGTVEKPTTLVTDGTVAVEDYDDTDLNNEIATIFNEELETTSIPDVNDQKTTEKHETPDDKENDYDEDTTEVADEETNTNNEILEALTNKPNDNPQTTQKPILVPSTESISKEIQKNIENPQTTEKVFIDDKIETVNKIPHTTLKPIEPTTQVNEPKPTKNPITDMPENPENEVIEVDLDADFNWAIKKLNKTIIIHGDGLNSTYEYIVPHNVTTIIKLTNIVNVPTIVNVTNINNVHIHEEDEKNVKEDEDDEGEFGLGKDENGSCCIAVKPKSCHASSNGYKCHHRRFKTCGKQCTSRTIHVQQRKKCMNQECKHKVAYVPQPERQKCHYIDQWPFVVCSRNDRNGRYSRCDGCYDHYGYGYHNYYGQTPPKCYGCYDDGFQHGPLYRKGPYFWPNFYHQPPCYVTGTCGFYPYHLGGYFGHEMVDPAWGHSEYEPEMNEDNNFYVDDVFDENSSNGTDQNWGEPIKKCAVVSENNTVSIQNCDTNLDNPYMAAPVSYPYYPPINYMRPNNRKYRKRHRPVLKQNQMHAQSKTKDKHRRTFVEEGPGDY